MSIVKGQESILEDQESKVKVMRPKSKVKSQKVTGKTARVKCPLWLLMLTLVYSGCMCLTVVDPG